MDVEIQDQMVDVTNIEILNHSQLYPKKEIQYDENISDDDKCIISTKLQIPLLNGEYIKYISKSGKLNEDFILITNYRLLNILNNQASFINFPLMQIDHVETKDILFVYVYLKNSKTIRLIFSSNEKCLQWYQRLVQITTSRIEKLDTLFAFSFYSWHADESQTQTFTRYEFKRDLLKQEFKRLEFGMCANEWRLSEVNRGFKLCSTYPEYLIVPASITDDELKKVANFRSSKRFPTVVWRSKQNGCVLARSSQPNVGLLGWRLAEDEQLVRALSHTDKYLLIIDARCRSVALANRVKGGGYEYSEYYTNCEIQFMNLENIHVVRSSFQSLGVLCQTQVDNKQFLSQLEHTKWLHHLSAILKAAITVVSTIDRHLRSVLIHCSDGWDRTPQILALAKILLDPYYRTIEGFQVLIEIEWLQFGHKFSQRNGHAVNFLDSNERCPVFLQWLDCVYQLTQQFPTAFEFNEHFLLKLCFHSYSCLFGTFLCDSQEERVKENLFKQTFSVWSYLNSQSKQFINFLYDDSIESILYPQYELVNLKFWLKLYCDSDLVHLAPQPQELSITSNESSLTSSNNKNNTKCLSAPISSAKKSCSLNDLTKLTSSIISSNSGSSPPANRDDSIHVHLMTKSSSNTHVETTNVSNSITYKTSTDTLVEHKQAEINEETNARSVSTSTSGLSDFVYTTKLDRISSTIKRFELQTFDQKQNKSLRKDEFNSSTSLNGSFYFPQKSESGSNINNNNNTTNNNKQMKSSYTPLNGSIITSSISSNTTKTLKQCIDIDGLTIIDDNCFKKIIEREDNYKKEILLLKAQIQKCKSFLSSLSTNNNLWQLDHYFLNELQQSDCYDLKSDNNNSFSNAHLNNHNQPNSFSSESFMSGSWDELEKPELTTWIPDHTVTHCQDCNKEFTLATRKHHCRNCGYVFCHKCSNHFYPLPEQNLNTPVRICVKCKLEIDKKSIVNKENLVSHSNTATSSITQLSTISTSTTSTSTTIANKINAKHTTMINSTSSLANNISNSNSSSSGSMCNLNMNRSLNDSLNNSQQKVSV